MGEVVQFPVIRIAKPAPITEIPIAFVENAKEYAGKLRAGYLRRCMENAQKRPDCPSDQLLLIWAVDDFLRWYGA